VKIDSKNMSIEDRFEIVQILNRYALAVDSQRWSLFDDILTTNSVLSYSATAEWRNLDTFKRDFEGFVVLSKPPSI
jgi:hypothetical protein